MCGPTVGQRELVRLVLRKA